MKAEKKNSNLWFALGWIAAYVVVMSVAESGVEAVGSQSIRLIAALPLAAIVYFAGSRHGGLKQYGFSSMRGLPWRKLLYTLPLAVLATENLWRGVAPRFSAREAFCYVASMVCVGLLEELIFRGFLLKALLPDGVRSAVLITGITFGLGHIVNLLHGAELVPTLLQLCYAASIGLMLGVFVVRTDNIVPCCIFHAVFNALVAFSAPAAEEMLPKIVAAVVIMALSLGYAAYLWYCTPPLSEGNGLAQKPAKP